LPNRLSGAMAKATNSAESMRRDLGDIGRPPRLGDFLPLLRRGLAFEC
jgi:hypothetical protein